MKVYVAAPWVNKEEAARAAYVFEQAGHTITKRWWEHREVPGYPMQEPNEELYQQAVEDVKGVADADVVVLLNLAKSEGKAVETGVALALDTPIILVGERTNLFHYLEGNVIVVPSVAAASMHLLHLQDEMLDDRMVA